MRTPMFIARTVLLSLVLATTQAHAYKAACEYVFSDKFSADVNLAPQSKEYANFIRKFTSSEKVLSSMARYQKIMGFEKIDQTSKSLDEVKVRFKALSAEQKTEMMKLVSDVYNDVKLLKYSKDGPVKFFKRHLDMMVSEYLSPRAYFRKMIYQRNASIEKTMDLYFQEVQRLTDAPVVLEGQDILLSALRLQDKFLVKEKQQGPIVMYGSFVNGKAYEKTSDMDFAVVDARIETVMREADTLGLLEEFPFSDAQPHVVKPKEIQGLGYMNPIVVIVKDKVIEVRVYGSGPEKAHQNGKVPFDAYYF